jgi:valyl-tRNA synthetase
MKYLVKFYPRGMKHSPKEIRSKKQLVESPSGMSNHEARRHIVDQLHAQGCFVKAIQEHQEA